VYSSAEREEKKKKEEKREEERKAKRQHRQSSVVAAVAAGQRLLRVQSTSQRYRPADVAVLPPVQSLRRIAIRFLGLGKHVDTTFFVPYSKYFDSYCAFRGRDSIIACIADCVSDR